MSNGDEAFPCEKWELCDVISPEINPFVHENLTSRPKLALLLPALNFIMIGVF